MWVLLAVCSALCLGFYDVSKKRALQQSDVLSVLSGSVCISACILCVPLLLSRLMPEVMETTLFFVPRLTWQGHLYVFLKSCIVLSSWVFAYISVKYLPLSVVSPMQATRPMWTLLGAMLIFGERLNGWQWAGVICALGSIFLFSLTEKKHDKTLPRKANRKYYICLLLAILIGSASGLYDKYMMRHYDHNAVQVYYTVYQALMMLAAYFILRQHHPSNSLHERGLGSTASIACISVFLVLSDYVYMLALSDPDSMIAIVSTIRRGGTVIPFLYGILILREPNAKQKIACLTGVLLGLLCLTLATI